LARTETLTTHPRCWLARSAAQPLNNSGATANAGMVSGLCVASATVAGQPRAFHAPPRCSGTAAPDNHTHAMNEDLYQTICARLEELEIVTRKLEKLTRQGVSPVFRQDIRDLGGRINKLEEWFRKNTLRD